MEAFESVWKYVIVVPGHRDKNIPWKKLLLPFLTLKIEEDKRWIVQYSRKYFTLPNSCRFRSVR